MKRSARVARVWCDHPEPQCALITCFSSMHPAASSRRNYLTSQERLVNNLQDCRQTDSTSRTRRAEREGIGCEWKCWGTPPGPSAFPRLRQPVGSFFPCENHLTHDLLRTRSFWTTGDTYISIDWVTTTRRRDRIAHSYMNWEIRWVYHSSASI